MEMSALYAAEGPQMDEVGENFNFHGILNFSEKNCGTFLGA